MHPVLIVAAVLLLGLVVNAVWAVATNRPHTPATPAGPGAYRDPMAEFASILQSFVDRHPDGTSHAFTSPAPAGTHACESVGYCHHTALACRCGATVLRGYSVPEVR